MKLFKSLFCKHDYRWLRNIYGDQINFYNGKRSIHECIKCGKWKFGTTLGGK